MLIPALIDVHVHFRDPGNTDAETLETGLSAAIRGGFGAVVTMPNTTPACDSAELIARQIAASNASCSILPAGCLTKGRRGEEVAGLEAMAKAGAIAFSDDGNTVAADDVMREAMERAARLGLPVMDHAVLLPSLWDVYKMPAEAEAAVVARDVDLARKTGCALHIQHISRKESIEIIRAARAEGLPVTAEATPHHLLLDETMIPNWDTNWKMNPPLATPEDREALVNAVAEGVITILATDHAPHTRGTKLRGWEKAPFGIVGLETAFAAAWTALKNHITPERFVELWTTEPAKLLKIEVPARKIEVDFDCAWNVKTEQFVSKSRNCPYEGMKLYGRVV